MSKPPTSQKLVGANRTTHRTRKKRKSPTGRLVSIAWHQTFLEAVAETGCIRLSAIHAGTTKSTAYDHRKWFDDFRLAWDEALEIGIERLEAEARRRAVNGVMRKKWMKDEDGKPICIDEIREYSDVLLIFLLKAHRPDRYRDHYEGQQKGDSDLTAEEVQKEYKRLFGVIDV